MKNTLIGVFSIHTIRKLYFPIVWKFLRYNIRKARRFGKTRNIIYYKKSKLSRLIAKKYKNFKIKIDKK